jgi:hypothetical protein
MERANLVINEKIRDFLSMHLQGDDKEMEEIMKRETISYSYLKDLCLNQDNGIEILDDIIRSTHLHFQDVDNDHLAFSEEEKRYRKLVGLTTEITNDQREWRHVFRELSIILNGLFSVVGSGIAIFIITGYVTKLTLEWRIMTSFLISFIILIAELFLVIRFHQVSSSFDISSKKLKIN